MDLFSISPSWVEHCSRLLPGLAWVPFVASDNDIKSADDEFIQVTLANVKRLLELPFALCVSLMAFDQDLSKFLDSYLKNRERVNPNRELVSLDVAVFTLFYRFVADVPPGVKFTAGAKSDTLFGLQVLTPMRLLLLVALFYEPQPVEDINMRQIGNSPVADLVQRWVSLNPQLEKEISRMLESWSLTKPMWTARNAAGLRGLQVTLPSDIRKRILPCLAGVRGTVWDAIKMVARWYGSCSGPVNSIRTERGHLLVILAYGLVDLEGRQTDEFLLCVLGENEDFADNEKEMLKDMVIGVPWFRDAFVTRAIEQLRLDDSRVHYVMNAIETFPSSDNPGDPAMETKSIVYVNEPVFGGSTETAAIEEEQGALDPVDQLKEIAPHLGRYFCRRLLEVFNWDLSRAIAAVMEGTLPEEVLHIDFGAEDEPTTVTSSSTIIRSTRDDRDADAMLKDRIDGDIKSHITSLYTADEYDDEYDDTLDDGGGRLAVDTGAKNLDEDDPEEPSEIERDAEDEPIGQSRAGSTAEVPVFVHKGGRDSQQFEKRQQSRLNDEGGDGQNKHRSRREHLPAHGSKIISSSKSAAPAPRGPREMIAPVYRGESVVDVDGVRRNAQGKQVEEDELMRPNLNRITPVPVETERRQKQHRGAHSQQERVLTPEQEAQRVKRERERKEHRGNQVRQKGADRKQTKSGF